MVEVTRHAWQANYNFPEPTKYVGRYVIYIAVMAWLTVFILLQNRLKTSLAKSVLTTVISIAAIILSYQAFYNPTWVSNDFLLNFRFVDAYSFSFFHWIFLTFLAALAIATAYFFFLGKNRASLGILIAGIFILNLVPWPGYFDKYVYFSTAPRHLDALLAFNETMFSEQTTKPVLVVSTGSNFYEEELEVRGFAPDMFRVRTAANDPLRADFCRTRLMIRYADGSRLAVVDKTAECKLDDEAALTSYRYNGMEYAVIKLPISK